MRAAERPRLRLLHASRGVPCGHAPSSLPLGGPRRRRRTRRGPLSSPSILSAERSPIKPLTRCALHGPRASHPVVIRRHSFRSAEPELTYDAQTKMLLAMQLQSNLASRCAASHATSTCLPCARLKSRYARQNIGPLIKVSRYHISCTLDAMSMPPK